MEERRKCSRCYNTKDITRFKFVKGSYSKSCLSCLESRKKYYSEHSEERQQWKVDNPELWAARNREQCRRYRESHQEEISEKHKQWRQDNREELLHKKRRYYSVENLPAHLQHTIQARIRTILGGEHAKKWREYLGCTIEEYIPYLEAQFQPGMEWAGHSRSGWNIDHILPFKEPGINEEEVIRRFHYTNTQPLWNSQNRAKKNKVPPRRVSRLIVIDCDTVQE